MCRISFKMGDRVRLADGRLGFVACPLLGLVIDVAFIRNGDMTLETVPKWNVNNLEAKGSCNTCSTSALNELSGVVQLEIHSGMPKHR